MKKHALLVGVEDYRDKMISRLNFARADATALAERLSNRCGFDHVRVLANESGEDEPLLVNIITALRDTSAELRQDDLFLFFFAGHGVEKHGHGYLLARDSLHAFPEHASLSLELLRKTFEHLSASKRILLLDACRNSPDAGRADAANCMGDVISRDIVAAARSKLTGGTTTALLSACRSGQRAYEWPGKGHGVFTQYLVEGLDGAAWTGDELEFDRLAGYAAGQVRQWAANTPGLPIPQEPWYEKFGDPQRIVLATTLPEESTLTPAATEIGEGVATSQYSQNSPCTWEHWVEKEHRLFSDVGAWLAVYAAVLLSGGAMGGMIISKLLSSAETGAPLGLAFGFGCAGIVALVHFKLFRHYKCQYGKYLVDYHLDKGELRYAVQELLSLGVLRNDGILMYLHERAVEEAKKQGDEISLTTLQRMKTTCAGTTVLDDTR